MLSHAKNSFKTLLEDFSHLFFPRICIGCGNDILARGALLCMACMHRLPLTNFHIHGGNPVEKIFWGRLPVSHASSFCYFTKDSLVQRLLFQLKYKGHRELGCLVGNWMGETLRQSQRFDDIDVLIPLPLFPGKEKARGYNQSALLCQGMATRMQLPVIENCLVRTSATETQTHKGRIARWQNIDGKFKLQHPEPIRNKHVLLVDDVITTGATLEACGHELVEKGNVRLSIACFAYTVK